ncbi:MAG: dihydrofolate synthase/folylpolyglutamate synthase, partial [Psychrobacter okhotskensis]
FKRLSEATDAVINGSQAQDLIVVCGSFHTIGEVLAAFEE